ASEGQRIHSGSAAVLLRWRRGGRGRLRHAPLDQRWHEDRGVEPCRRRTHGGRHPRALRAAPTPEEGGAAGAWGDEEHLDPRREEPRPFSALGRRDRYPGQDMEASSPGAEAIVSRRGRGTPG